MSIPASRLAQMAASARRRMAGTDGPARRAGGPVRGASRAGLISHGISYAVAGSGTGLYVSLNCEDFGGRGGDKGGGVHGGGWRLAERGGGSGRGWVHGHRAGRGGSCPDSGTVNTLEADTAAAIDHNHSLRS
jgi:hypothetical protein